MIDSKQLFILCSCQGRRVHPCILVKDARQPGAVTWASSHLPKEGCHLYSRHGTRGLDGAPSRKLLSLAVFHLVFGMTSALLLQQAKSRRTMMNSCHCISLPSLFPQILCPELGWAVQAIGSSVADAQQAWSKRKRGPLSEASREKERARNRCNSCSMTV